MTEQLFETEGNNPPQDPPKEPEGESWADKLAQQKGDDKFKRDFEEVAKSAFHANEHIVRLEDQIKQQAEDLSNSVTKDEVEELVKKMANEISVQRTPNEGNTTPVDSSELESLVTSVVEKREQQSVTQRNIQTVQESLKEAFGTEDEKHVKAKSEELNMTMDEMTALAARSPAAFMSLMGQPLNKQTNSMPTSAISQVNNTNERNYEYYSKLRKENPKLYYSPKIQLQMGEDRQKLGDKF